jgi:hypothetical protein
VGEGEKPLPLHVKVAEVLGCKPYYVAPEENRPEDGYYVITGWRCGCTVREHGLSNVHRYDVAWSVTGPLIEKFKLAVREDCGWIAYFEFDICGGEVDYQARAEGETLLGAVCNLIVELKEKGVLNV